MRYIACLILIALLTQCQNKEKVNPTPATTPITLPDAPIGPTIRSIAKDGTIQLENSSVQAIPHFNDPAYTILYLVRHCEKESGEANPPLTAQGQARAERLGRVLDLALLDRIGCTNTKRTIETAQIVQRWTGDPGMENFPAEGSLDWLSETLETGKGRKILYVGHQSTVPQVLNALTNSIQYKSIPEQEFSRFYIAVTKGIGSTEVLGFCY